MDSILAVLNVLVQLLGALAAVPVVGKILVVVVASAGALAGVSSALVAMWRAVVLVLASLSLVPGLSGLKAVADKLKTSQDAVDDFEQNKILPILNRLSTIPLPKKPEDPAA